MRLSRLVLLACLIFFLFITISVTAQEPVPAPTYAPAPAAAPAPPAGFAPMVSSGPLGRLLIGPGDEGDLSVYGVPELGQHVRVTETGEIDLPLVGKVMIAGMTAEEAQAAIEKKLVDGGFVNNPHVTLAIKEYTSEGITVLGEVARPGTYSALSARRLYDAFMAAGGLTPRAGTTVAISHRNSGEAAQTVTLSNDPAKSAASNVELKPGDTVVVSRAGVVYVVGEVGRPGEFVIENPDSMTVMRVIAMAAGPTRMASLTHAKMLRRTPAGLQNTELNLKNIIEAKAPDMPLQAEDILFIPPSKSKAAAERGANSVLSMLTSLALYRF